MVLQYLHQVVQRMKLLQLGYNKLININFHNNTGLVLAFTEIRWPRPACIAIRYMYISCNFCRKSCPFF